MCKARVAISTLSQTLAAPTGLLGYFAQLARFLPAADPSAEYYFIVTAATRDWIAHDAPGAFFHEVGWDDSNRPLRLLSEHLLLGRWLERNAIDILYLANAGVSPLYLPPDVRLVLGIFAFHQFTAGQSSLLRQTYRRLFFGRAVDRARRIVLNSEYSASLLSQHAPQAVAKSAVIPHGVDRTLFHAGEVAPSDLAALAALGILAPYFLFVSQMYPYKNVATAVAAFGLFCRRHSTAHRFVLVGRFDPRFSAAERYRAHLLAVAAGHGVADRLIMIDALPIALLRAAYRGAAAYLQPSLAETFGKTSLEAMACACPVIAADAGATREVVGDAGLYFPPMDAEACASLLEAVTQDTGLVGELIARGRGRAASLTIEAEAAALARVFREVGAT